MFQEDWNQEKSKSSATDDPNPPDSESPEGPIRKKPKLSHGFEEMGRSQHGWAFNPVGSNPTLPLNPEPSNEPPLVAEGVNPAAAGEPVAQAAEVQPQAYSTCLDTHSDGDKDESGD